MAARSEAWVCGRSLVGIAGSNHAGGMHVSRECYVLSDRGLCYGLISSPEESHRISACMCVSLNVIGCNNNHLHLQERKTELYLLEINEKEYGSNRELI